MFIKHIKVCGLFGINHIQEHNFTYENNEKSDSENNYINSIKDIRIIQALMLIFDLKYDSKYDYKDIINKNFKDDSFVEVILHQNECGGKFSQYDWLEKKELKLKRVLQNPKSIFINKKRCDLSTFHHALISLGFQNVHNLSIHKLMDDDITKVSNFVGDDFWNMLIKIIEHEEIIEMVERREGIVKKKAMARSYDIVADKVLREIPKKVQLRKDIHDRIQLNKRFFTLLTIIHEQKVEFFKKQKDLIDQRFQEIKDQINSIVVDEHVKKRECFADLNKVLTSGNVFKIFQDILDNLNYFVNNYKGEEREQLIFYFLEGFAKFETKSIDHYLDADNDPNNFVNNEIAAIKLCLAESIKDGKFEETKEILKALHEFDQQLINFMESDEAFPIFDSINKTDCSMDKDLISEFEQWKINEELQIAEKIKNFDTAESYLTQINKYLVDLKLSNDDFETLISIEKLIESLPEIKDDYLGPVFLFLDTSSDLGVKMWNDISSIVYTLLFKTSESKIYFAVKFHETVKKHTRCEFCSIDEYPIQEFKEIHDSESYESMKDLVKKNLSSKQLESVILSLLQPFLLGNKTDSEDYEIDEMGAFVVKLYNNSSSTSYHDGGVNINSEWNNIWEQSEKGPVQVLQEYYQLVKEYIKVDTQFKTIKKNIEKFQNIKFTALDECVDKITKSTTIKNDKSDPMIKARKDINNKINQVLQANQAECQKWNTNELKEQANFVATTSAHDQYAYIDNKVIDNNILVQFINSKLSETLAVSEGCHDRNRIDKIQKIKKSEKFQELLKSIETLNAQNTVKEKDLEELMKSVEVYVKDVSENQELMTYFGGFYAEKVRLEDMIVHIKQFIQNTKSYGPVCYDENIYEKALEDKSIDEIISEISDVYDKILRLKAVNRMDIKALDPSVYLNLVESLGKVREFSNKEIYNPLNVRKRAFPLMNAVVVKVLKDTVHNFTITYNSVLSDYISNSNLFFYTKSELNEVDDKNFTWSYFDISKLKSIEFVEKWKDEKRILPSTCRQLIKALLLILHIINYMSVFKFIIISEKLFEGMDQYLVNQLRKFLKNISKFVQIVLHEKSENAEPMEVDERDYLEE